MNFGEVLTVFGKPHWKEMERGLENVRYGFAAIPKDCDEYIVVGGKTIITLKQRRPDIQPTKYILTDSNYVRYKSKINRITRNHNVLIMPDLVKHRGELPYKIFYHPFDMSDVEIEKYNTITVCHSPATLSKRFQKGSDFILSAITNLPREIQYLELRDYKWHDAIKIKSKCHIVIDQIDDMRKDFNPALGKSGLEGMHLGCATLSNYTYVPCDIPEPPVVKVSRETLSERLLNLIDDRAARSMVVDEQIEWALRYTNPTFVAQRILMT